MKKKGCRPGQKKVDGKCKYLLAIRDEHRPPGAVILSFDNELDRLFVIDSLKDDVQWAKTIK